MIHVQLKLRLEGFRVFGRARFPGLEVRLCEFEDAKASVFSLSSFEAELVTVCVLKLFDNATDTLFGEFADASRAPKGVAEFCCSFLFLLAWVKRFRKLDENK